MSQTERKKLEFEGSEYLSKEMMDNIYEVVSEEYDLGVEDGKDGVDEEKIGVTYAVEQFADCNTLEDYKEKQMEITRRSYNFM
jgi:hypothetical protein